MADMKISQLPTVAVPTLSDYLVGDFSNNSYTGRVLLSNLATLFASSSTINAGTITNSTISGGTIANTPISGNTGAFTTLSHSGLMTGGTGINYTDTGLLSITGSNVNSYNQIVIQNQNSGAAASTNFNISNDLGTATTNFGEFGINSSGFTGTGSFSQAGNVYLASATTDLVLGTYGPKSIRFVVNSGATDAMVIDASGNLAITAPSGSLGYGTGAGGIVTQLTSRTTSVTLTKPTGQVTLFTAAPTVGAWLSFNIVNSLVTVNDTVVVSVTGASNTYVATTSVGAGAIFVSFTSINGTASDTPKINFAIIKGAVA